MLEGVARQFGLPIVEVPATARTPEAVLRHLVERLAAEGLADAEAVEATVRHLLKREEIASTGLGRGFALPHCKTTAVSHPTGAVGRVPHGVDWGGVDAEPVTAVCLLLCPGSGGGVTAFLRMLEAVAREAAAGLGGRQGSEGQDGMTEREWLACTDPQKMLDFLNGKTSDRKLRLFAAACCRRFWPLLTDERSRRAVEVAERYAGGRAGRGELHAAFEAASVARDETMRRLQPRGPLGLLRHLWSLPARVQSALAVSFAAQAAAVPVTFPVVAELARGTAEKDSGGLPRLLRDIFGNPFRPFSLNPDWLAWNDGTVRRLAETIYEGRAFERLAVLADALEEAGCTDADMLAHCRGPGPHVLGCWVVDALLGKQ